MSDRIAMEQNFLPEEGGACPNGCVGSVLFFDDVEGCSCHISPPCAACVNNPLTCNVCKETFEP